MDAFDTQLCARARFWGSLRVDGELSQLESALLDAHLESCARCRAVVGGIEQSTTLLRSVPAERMAPLPLALPRSRHRFIAAAGVAAVLAAGALAGGLIHSGTGTTARQEPRAVAVVSSFETTDQIRQLRRTMLLNERRIPRDLADPV